MNNFKKLQNQELEQYNQPNKNIQRNISKSLGIFQFIGNMVDLFFTKFVGAALGSSIDSNSKYPNNKN